MIHHGDCIEVMATFDAESVDAIVTDPPYGLTFMGKGWDDLSKVPDHSGPQWGGYGWRGSGATPPNVMQRWHERWAAEAFRIAKPGAYLLAFGGTRTYHRLAAAIEDAGWEIRDTLVWAYASGFPKSLNPGRANDTAACQSNGTHVSEPDHACPMISPPEMYGLGTALKPAWEPIVMARKPLRGTVVGNWIEYGTGAINVDGCRIGTDGAGWNGLPRTPAPESADILSRSVSKRSKPGTAPAGTTTDHDVVRAPTSKPSESHGGIRLADRENGNSPTGGRWPANVILTDPIFDGDTPGVVGGGETMNGGGLERATSDHGYDGGWVKRDGERIGKGDSGTYSRFFLVPKAARADREPVLLRDPAGKRLNEHPTVKPTELMRHLVRLVTPPGGVVLDPFLGSGTTALAAEQEGREWVGIEREAEYVAMAEARLPGTQRGLGLTG